MDDAARRDLEMVRLLMVDARGAQTEHGPFLVLWGVLVSIGLLLTWAAVAGMAVPNPGWTWSIVQVVGWIGSAILGARSERRRGRMTPGARVLMGVWTGAGVTLTLIGLAGLFVEGVPVQLLPGLTSVVLGSAYWATSWVTGRMWERLFGAGWWVAGAAMLVWSNGTWTLLVQGVLVLLFMVVPGVVLLRAAAAEAERRPARVAP